MGTLLIKGDAEPTRAGIEVAAREFDAASRIDATVSGLDEGATPSCADKGIDGAECSIEELASGNGALTSGRALEAKGALSIDADGSSVDVSGADAASCCGGGASETGAE